VFDLVSEKTVKHVSKLARLNLTDKEVRKFTKQIDDILDIFKTLDKIKTKNVKPSFQPLEIKNIWREDKPKKYDWKPLSNTKNKEKNYFKGPRAV